MTGFPTSDSQPTVGTRTLLAPSASSTSGVTLEGQHLDHQALWQGRPKVQILRPTRDGSYVLWVRGESAALVTVPVAPSTLNSPGQHASGRPCADVWL
jgi:hypothetical protein